MGNESEETRRRKVRAAMQIEERKREERKRKSKGKERSVMRANLIVRYIDSDRDIEPLNFIREELHR